jgi:cell wall-associated NlpC family hydrolase
MINIIKTTLIIMLALSSAELKGQQQGVWSYKDAEGQVEVTADLLDSIFERANDFLNTKYVYGGRSPSGFDCSGFIYYLFKEFNILLSPSASQLSRIGQKIEFEEIREGDLLFFKSRDISSNHVGHVALVICSSDNLLEMIHATNRGVVIDDFNHMNYYQKRYLIAKRFISVDDRCAF